MDTAITLGYYLSSFGFLVASVVMGMAVRKFGRSALGSILSYFFIGTVTFFVITIFQKLGGEFFGISDASMDVWWHVMFYLATASYYLGLRALIGLGSADPSAGSATSIGSEKVWGIFSAAVLVAVFTLPGVLEPLVLSYDSSPLGQLGLHHFLAFFIAFTVGSYLLTAKKNLGQIGHAIANPMVVAIWAFGLQHFWELLFESWKWVNVTSEVGEGGEKIFLIIAAGCITYAAWRLKSFAQG